MSISNEELAILRQKVKMFDLYNKNKTEDIAKLNTELSCLVKERDLLCSKLSNHGTLIANMSNHIMMLNKEISNLREQIEATARELEKKNLDNERLQRSMEELQKQKADIQSNNVERASYRNRLLDESNANDKQNEIISELRSTLTQLHNSLVQVSSMNQTLYNQSNERALTIKNLEAENERLEKSASDAKNKIRDLDAKYKQVSNTNDLLSRQLDEKVRALQDLRENNITNMFDRFVTKCSDTIQTEHMNKKQRHV